MGMILFCIGPEEGHEIKSDPLGVWELVNTGQVEALPSPAGLGETLRAFGFKRVVDTNPCLPKGGAKWVPPFGTPH